MVHPQNIGIQNVRFQNVYLPNNGCVILRDRIRNQICWKICSIEELNTERPKLVFFLAPTKPPVNVETNIFAKIFAQTFATITKCWLFLKILIAIGKIVIKWVRLSETFVTILKDIGKFAPKLSYSRKYLRKYKEDFFRFQPLTLP